MGLMQNPSHPGEILKHEFLEPYGLSSIRLAKIIDVPRTRIERIVKGTTSVTPDTALRLSKAFGTTPEFWVNMQANYDMAAARKEVDVSAIKPLVAA